MTPELVYRKSEGFLSWKQWKTATNTHATAIIVCVRHVQLLCERDVERQILVGPQKQISSVQIETGSVSEVGSVDSARVIRLFVRVIE